MSDVVMLSAQSQAFLDRTIKQLAEIMDERDEPVDMKLMIEVMHDLLAGTFTAGDLAVVYAYRDSVRKQEAGYGRA